MTSSPPQHELLHRRLAITELRPFEGNPRRGNIDAIAASLSTIGQYRPIVVNAGTHTGRRFEVLAGNHTMLAAKKLGWTSLECVVVDVVDEQAARIVAADNRTADLGGYDDAELLSLLESLPDLAGTGYDSRDLAEIAARASGSPLSLTDPDEAPPVPVSEPFSESGDVWLLGAHRLVCGDARDPSVQETALAGARPDLLFTDPPYGISYRGAAGSMLNDDLGPDELYGLLVAALSSAARRLPPGGVFYVCSPSGPLETVFRQALQEAGLPLHQQLVWVKNTFTLSRADYQPQHETILHGAADDGDGVGGPDHGTVLYGWREGAAHRWEGGRRQSTVWLFDKPARSREHPTMKPVALVQQAIENSSREGGLVLDVFGGSGSTLIAAHLSRRRASLVELDPRYVDVICRRWQEHTGVVPELQRGRGRLKPVDFTGGA